MATKVWEFFKDSVRGVTKFVSDPIKKRVTTFILNKALGKFCEDLNLDQIKLEIFEGALEIHRLKLNLDFINKQLQSTPFVCVGGSISNVTLTVPWDDLMNKDILFSISDIDVLLKLKEDYFQTETILKSFSENLEVLRNESELTSSFYDNTNGGMITQQQVPDEEESREQYVEKSLNRLISNFKVEVKKVKVKIELLQENTFVELIVPGVRYEDESEKKSVEEKDWKPEKDIYSIFFEKNVIIRMCQLINGKEKVIVCGDASFDHLKVNLLHGNTREVVDVEFLISHLHLIVNKVNFIVLLETLDKLKELLSRPVDSSVESPVISGIVKKPIVTKEDPGQFGFNINFTDMKEEFEKEELMKRGENESKKQVLNIHNFVGAEDDDNYLSDDPNDDGDGEESEFESVYNGENERLDSMEGVDKLVKLILKSKVKIEEISFDILYSDEKTFENVFSEKYERKDVVESEKDSDSGSESEDEYGENEKESSKKRVAKKISVLDDHVHFGIYNSSIFFENNETQSKMSVKTQMIEVLEKFFGESEVRNNYILYFQKGNCLRLDMSFMKDAIQWIHQVHVSPMSITADFSAFERITSLLKGYKSGKPETSDEYPVVSGLSLNDYEQEEKIPTEYEFKVNFEEIQFFLLVPEINDQIQFVVKNMFLKGSFNSLHGDNVEVSIGEVLGLSLCKERNPELIFRILKPKVSLFFQDKDAKPVLIREISFEKGKSPKVNDPDSPELFKIDAVEEQTRLTRMFKSCSTGLHLEASLVEIFFSLELEQTIFKYMKKFQDAMSKIKENVSSPPEPAKSPKFFQEEDQFMQGQKNITDVLVPSLGLQIDVDDIKLNLSVDDRTTSVGLLGLHTHAFIYSDPITIAKVSLKIKELWCKRLGEDLVVGKVRLIKDFRKFFHCVSVDLQFKSDSFLNMTNMKLKAQVNGVCLFISDPSIFGVLAQDLQSFIPPMEDTLDNSKVSVSFTGNDIGIDFQPVLAKKVDYSTFFRKPRILTVINTVRFSTVMVQNDDNMKLDLGINELDILLHRNCNIDIIRDYCSNENDDISHSVVGSPGGRAFGFVNNLSKTFGFVVIGSVKNVVLEVLIFKEGARDRGNKAKTKIILDRVDIQLGLCFDSVKCLMDVGKVMTKDGEDETEGKFENIDSPEEKEPELFETIVIPEKKASVPILSAEVGKKIKPKRLTPSSGEVVEMEEEIQKYEERTVTITTTKFKGGSINIYPEYHKCVIQDDYFAAPKEKEINYLPDGFPAPDVEVLLHETNISVKMFRGNDFKIDVIDSENVGKKYIPRDLSTCVEVLFSGLFLNFHTFPELSSHANCVKFKIKDFEILDKLSNSTANKILCYYEQKSRNRLKSESMLDVWFFAERDPQTRDPTILSFELKLSPIRLNLHQGSLYFLTVDFALPILGFDIITWLSKQNKIEKSPEDEGENIKMEENGEKEQIEEGKKINESYMLSPASPEFGGNFFRKFKVGQLRFKIDYIGGKGHVDFNHGEVWLLKATHTLLNYASVREVKINLDEVERRSLPQSVLAEEVTNLYSGQLPGCMVGMFLRLLPYKRVLNVGTGVADIFVIPIREYYREEGSVMRGIMKGVSSFVTTLSGETVGGVKDVMEWGSKMTRMVEKPFETKEMETKKMKGNIRPANFSEGVNESLARVKSGFSRPYYAFVAIPKAEGVIGKTVSTVKAIPLVFLSPISGLTEAVTKLLQGVNSYYDPRSKREFDTLNK